jgi:hypothetical protein
MPIEDRQFVSFVQFFLHKCGQITLGNMEIISKSPPNGNESVIVNEGKQEWPLPDVQMPENIKDFKEIHIRFAVTPTIDALTLTLAAHTHFFGCTFRLNGDTVTLE